MRCGSFWLSMKLLADHVDSAELAGILGIGLGVVGDLLALGQGTEALGLDGGEVDEHVAAAVIVGDEAEALFVVEPFDSTVIHVWNLLKKLLSRRKKRSHGVVVSQNETDRQQRSDNQFLHFKIHV